MFVSTDMHNIQTKILDDKSNSAIGRPIYLDCNATAPLEPAVADLMIRYFTEEVGNAASRTHEYGLNAKKAVQSARQKIAEVVNSEAEEVIFTSGATESNNIAILGLAEFGEVTGKKHIISTAIEHKAVLEPLQQLQARGFEVTFIKPDHSGAVEAEAIKDALRDDTLLVSIMHANNETGILQPIFEIAKELAQHKCYFHVDAAQGFGKEIDALQSQRIDLISISSHKIYGPVGIGALVTRRRKYDRAPLKPLVFGGGQERGLRAGTLPTPLIVGFGLSAEMANRDHNKRREVCETVRQNAISALEKLNVKFHGDQSKALPHVLNFSVPGIDSEAVILALKDIAAISNGSACTSQKYSSSHVLENMGLDKEMIDGAIRISWSHLTPKVPWDAIVSRIQSIM